MEAFGLPASHAGGVADCLTRGRVERMTNHVQKTLDALTCIACMSSFVPQQQKFFDDARMHVHDVFNFLC